MSGQAARSSDDDAQRKTMAIVIGAGAIVLGLSVGVRSIFGGVLEPLSSEFGWPREIFSLSLTIQNLVWGLAQPAFGAFADRYGERKALWIGFVCYLLGMMLTSVGATPLAQHLGAGVLVGAGISGTAFGLVLAVVGRTSPVETRSQNLGLVTALGGLGMLVLPTLAALLTDLYGWRVMLWAMTAMILPMALFIPLLKAPDAPLGGGATATAEEARLGTLELLRCACSNQSYVLLTLGFFVCGFHISFITVHFPAFVAERCGDPALGLYAIGIVGLMNVVGTFAAGQLGAFVPKNYLLSGIYALRALVILAFIALPITPTSVILFAIALGPLWLATVPLTSGLVAGMFGLRYLGALYGLVFLSHQLGSSLGIWLGGVLYDAYGSYDVVWFVAIGLGIMSAIAHLPVQERPHNLAPAR